MKICHVINSLSGGGAETHLLELVHSQKDKGHTVTVIAIGPDKKNMKSLEEEYTNISDNVLYQYRRYYVRENKSNTCPTLTANMGGGGHNVPLLKDNHGIRKLTPRECFNLQGFPQNYKLPNLSDSDLYKLAGNAVSVPVVKLIVKRLSSIIV